MTYQELTDDELLIGIDELEQQIIAMRQELFRLVDEARRRGMDTNWKLRQLIAEARQHRPV